MKKILIILLFVPFLCLSQVYRGSTPIGGGGGSDGSIELKNQNIDNDSIRAINTQGTGKGRLQDNGVTLMEWGGNNDQAVWVRALEALSGNTIGLTSPFSLPVLNITSSSASDYDYAIVRHSVDGEIYYSNGTDWFKLTNQDSSFPNTANQYKIFEHTGEIIIKDSLYESASVNKGSWLNIVDNGTIVLSDSVGVLNYRKPVIAVPYDADSLYIKTIGNDRILPLGTTDTINGYVAKNREPQLFYKVNENDWVLLGTGVEFNESPEPLYNVANAISINNETDSAIGVAYENGADGYFTSETGGAADGDYFIRGHNNGNDSNSSYRVALDSLVIGESYTVTFWARESGSNSSIFISNGFVDDGTKVDDVDGVWTQYTFTSVANATTANFAFYDGSNNLGDNNDVDGVTVTLNP